MAGSYERVNYALRPAKHIERKMICDTLRRLSEFGTVESYRYVGFGSIYFSDFTLIHKALGITDMVSIEHDEENRDRFLFNRPYSCIRMEFGESRDILPALSWDARTILWLDYDGKIEASVLTDVETFFAKAVPGSVIVVTLNVQPENMSSRPLMSLTSRVGSEKIPPGLDEKALARWGTADVAARILTNQVAETLAARNGGRSQGNKLQYKEIFHFRYADGARMQTVGGVVYEEGQSNLVAKCAFETFDFCMPQNHPYEIEVPKLTWREIRHLDRQLPVGDFHDLAADGIPEDDLERYRDVYRYFPAFAEAEV